MANDAKFNFYLNRTGPRGQKGEKGDQGFSPSITVNSDTADEYTLLIQNEHDSFVTDNIRPTYDDRGGTYVRVDRANNVQYFGSADIATTANYGEVKLAQASDLASTVDVGNSNVITAELLKTWFDGQLANNLVTTTNNVTIQGQKIFATPTRFMDTVRIGNRLMVTQEDTGTITFDSSETGTVIGTQLTSTGDASFSKNVTVDGIATIDGGLNVAGNAVISSPQLGNTTVNGDLTTKADINIQGQKVHLQHTNPTMYLKNMSGTNEIEIFRGLFAAGNPSPADNYLNIGHSQLQLNLTGKAIKANGKDVATTDTVDAMQSDLNIAKQDIIEAQGDIDNLQMNKQNKLTAGTGITIDADNVISATGGVIGLPIASSTTLGGIKVGENLTISEDGTLSATGGSTGDVSAAGNNTFTGENTFNGAVNLNGVSIAENLTVKRNLTSNGEINAVSIKTTGLRSDDIQTTTNKKYLTEVDVDNQTIQVVDGKLHANLESALANKQDKLTAGQGIGIDQSTNTISSTTPITYLTRAQYDALETKDANTMYVITDEEGGGGTPSDVPVTGVSAPLKLSGDTVYVPEMTGQTTEGFTVTASRFSAEYSSQYYKCFNASGNGWYAGNQGSGSDYIQIVFPRPLHLGGAYIKQNGNTNSLVSNYTLFITQNGTDWTEVLSDKLPQTVNYETSKIINSNCLGFRFRADGNYETNGAAIRGIILDLTELPTTATLGYDDNFVLDDSNQLSLNSVKFGKLSRPILDVPVNNCILAMPTAPTFDGTNVKVYAGTKVAIPNGLNADGTCKSNIVTLTADATINQSTFNGDITLMLKSDGTIDQTAYSCFEVDDISTITTLKAYCWYYDRKTNKHYLASSAGAKQGPYQRIKIGSYNQAEAATTKYFKTYRPIALESDNGRMVSREEFDALVARVAALEASINGGQST
jgi:cytoskeletal protein CcmA (bactofilin family)